ncbi:MAG: hypothetical protein P1U58_17455 [Verrucomicrobiales bacterium]|nr:hypothetical protein [Verrucomicrobiales bacterium]
MKKLIVVVNDLERSGKSSLARAVAHHLNESEVKNLLVTSNEMDMSDSYRGEFWDLEDQFDVSLLIGALDNYDAIVLDVHTGAARNWGEFCENEEIENLLAELDAEMTMVIPNSQGERCNEEITDLAEIFADQADYVVAQLPGDDRAVKWKASPAEKALRYLGASEVNFPGMSDDLVTALETSGVEFANALNNPSELPRFAEVQVTQWLEKANDALVAGQDYLLPEAVVEVALDY